MRDDLKNIEYIKKLFTQHKEALREKYGVKEFGLFGSYVRGEQKDISDVDILVEFEEDARISLLDFMCLENEVSDLLDINVDLVEKASLKPRIGRRILEEVVAL